MVTDAIRSGMWSSGTLLNGLAVDAEQNPALSKLLCSDQQDPELELMQKELAELEASHCLSCFSEYIALCCFLVWFLARQRT